MKLKEICPNCQKQKEFIDLLEMLNHVKSCYGKYRIQTPEEKAARTRWHLMKTEMRKQKKKEKQKKKNQNSRHHEIDKLKLENYKLRELVQSNLKHRESSFYESWGWCDVRLKALNIYGAKCMCCGSAENIEVDHIRPRSKYKYLELAIENLQILCRLCNRGKSNLSEKDYRPANWRDLMRRGGIVPVDDPALFGKASVPKVETSVDTFLWVTPASDSRPVVILRRKSPERDKGNL